MKECFDDLREELLNQGLLRGACPGVSQLPVPAPAVPLPAPTPSEVPGDTLSSPWIPGAGGASKRDRLALNLQSELRNLRKAAGDVVQGPHPSRHLAVDSVPTPGGIAGRSCR